MSHSNHGGLIFESPLPVVKLNHRYAWMPPPTLWSQGSPSLWRFLLAKQWKKVTSGFSKKPEVMWNQNWLFHWLSLSLAEITDVYGLCSVQRIIWRQVDGIHKYLAFLLFNFEWLQFWPQYCSWKEYSEKEYYVNHLINHTNRYLGLFYFNHLWTAVQLTI